MIENLTSMISQKNKLLYQSLIELRKSIFIEIIGSTKINPKSWEIVSLSDTAHFNFGIGKPIRKQNLDPNGEHQVYGANGPIGQHSKYLFDKRIIVIGRVGAYCGRVYVTRNNSWVTSNAITLQINECSFDLEFLAQMISMLNLNKFASGSAQSYLAIKRVKNLSVHKPPMPVQKKVSKYLSQIRQTEALIEERNRATQKLIELK